MRGRVALLTLPLFLAAAGRGSGQSVNPTSSVAVPDAGHLHAEFGFTSYRVDAFVEKSGARQEFPGSLDFRVGVLRLSYSPIESFALGLEVPYRWSSYGPSGSAASVLARGNPGLGAYLDWAPPGREDRLRPAFRLEYMTLRTGTDPVLTVSDGGSRFSGTFQLTALPGPLPAPWRGLASLRVEYGPPAGDDPRHLESSVQLQAGRRLVAGRSLELAASAVAGYQASSEARQEENLFHNRTSHGAFAGVLLSLETARSGIPLPSLSLSLTKDLCPRNAPSGWRVGLSFTRAF
ncbi:MAG TPA: hypothetical protein VIY96_01695 [Thermoanaerobaculia bacterium]